MDLPEPEAGEELLCNSLTCRTRKPSESCDESLHGGNHIFPAGRFFCETAIYIYNDNADHLNVMYLIIRCPSCSTFTYVDRFQKWKLCPQCGHAQEVARGPAYLDVEDYHEAEHIVRQMQKHLLATKKKDFTPEETAELRHHYTEALKKRGRHVPVQ